jgi:peptide/nickel transport system substrate-binding protein
MTKTRKALAGSTLIAVLLLGGIVAVSAQSQSESEGGPVTFDIGDPQGIDSMSPLIGITVAAYEAWNLQYAQVTGKAAKDFAPIPGLATSWTPSDDKLTWTYKFRPNAKWSDGKPLTAEDAAWTINTSRKEEWINHTAVTANLSAEAPDPTTLVVRTSVPDPKLPVMDVYILPKHVWGKMSPDERDKYDGEDGVGSGPFVLERFEKGQFARFKANPNYYGGKPAVDRVVLRKFNNPDAMVAALKTGELDAATDVPGNAFNQLKNDSNIQTIEGYQGAMSEVAINGGDGLKKPHPALLDPEVQRAIGHAIDKETLVDRVLAGLGKPAETLSVSPDTSWTPEIPEDQRFDFDLDKAKAMLDDAGYKDTDGDGIREMPGGGQPLNFRYMVRSDGETGPEIAEFVTGWLREIGIATTKKVASDTELTTIIGKGDYDIFAWGWVPFVDPDTMLSYFTCDQIASDPDDPTNYYNDANYCDPQYDKLYQQQKVELDRAKREEIVHEMLTRFQQSGTYHVLYTEPETQAYVKGRFQGLVRQPANTGPVFYSNSSPSYVQMKPATASAGGGGDGGGSSGGIIVGVVIAVLAVGAGAVWLLRRRTAYERE